MSARQIVYTDAGALRAPWRVVGFIVACVVATIVVSAIATPALAAAFRMAGMRADGIDYWVTMVGILIGTAFMLRVVEKRPWSSIWLDPVAARPRLLAVGLVVGSLAIGLPVLSLIAAGELKVENGGAGSWGAAAMRLTLALLPAALAEELFTRGYLLSALRDVWGWRWAVAATSVGFGLLHLRNPDATGRSLGLVVLAGVFLGYVLYATQSLYAAWMAHFAWNWTMAVVFHTAVSGIAMESPRYRYVDAGPSWATGGGWGPEGGIPAGAGMCAGMGIVYFVGRRGRVSRRVTS